MKLPVSPITAIYTEWLNSFRALIPGSSAATPPETLTPKQEQVAANQEWEDEGGSVKPPKVLDTEPVIAPKLPL